MIRCNWCLPTVPFTKRSRCIKTLPSAFISTARLRRSLRAPPRQIGSRTVRMLEIGGGTGPTTASRSAGDRGSRCRIYVYGYLACVPRQGTAKIRRLQQRPAISCSILSGLPLDQGFRAGSYDIVLAANVLHATRDLRQTVAHARQLLRPGGLLLLIEGVRPDRWLDMTFGLTDGWWRVADRELRPEHPLIPAEMWQSLFRENGMSLSRALQYKTSDGNLSQQVLMLACADQDAPVMAASIRSGNAGPSSPMQSGIGVALADLLAKRGEDCELISPGADSDQPGFRIGDASPTHGRMLLRNRLSLREWMRAQQEDAEQNIQLCMQMPVRLDASHCARYAGHDSSSGWSRAERRQRSPMRRPPPARSRPCCGAQGASSALNIQIKSRRSSISIRPPSRKTRPIC